MALMRNYVIAAFAILVVAFSSSSTIMARDIVVGDEGGWTLHFDYQTWAKERQFFVGDRLIFNYPEGRHNVYKVDGNGFKSCTYPAGANALTSGKDVITLAAAGERWYICGVANHCELGMKLVINVQQKQGSSDPNSASPRRRNPQYFAWMMVSFGLFMMIVV